MATIIDPPNSVWPNGLKVDSEGYVTFYPLGTNKVDISTVTWPDGDKLVSPFVYKNDKLVGFVDTEALTVSGSATTTMNYSHIEADFASISEGKLTVNAPNAIVKKFSWSVVDNGNDNVIVTIKYKGCETVDDVKAVDPDYLTTDIVDGVWSEGLGDLTNGIEMFAGCANLTTFTSDLSSLTDGTGMFAVCTNLTTFTSDLSSLTDGYSMFTRCSNLTSFEEDLSSLTVGNGMFIYCSALTTFTSDLSSLTNGNNMFAGCTNLTTFTSGLSSLTDGQYMFTDCANLTTFTSGLSSLTDGYSMFRGCSNLTTFTSDLSSLTEGIGMFMDCKLDTPSIKNISETIKAVTNKPKIYIGIGNTTPTEEENTYLAQIHNKGWQVYVNGSSSGNIFNPTATTPIDGEEVTTPIPYWAKPVPATEETAKYVDADGNFYNILGGQFIFVDDPDTYGMFINEEDAAANMRLTKIEKPSFINNPQTLNLKLKK